MCDNGGWYVTGDLPLYSWWFIGIPNIQEMINHDNILKDLLKVLIDGLTNLNSHKEYKILPSYIIVL